MIVRTLRVTNVFRTHYVSGIVLKLLIKCVIRGKMVYDILRVDTQVATLSLLTPVFGVFQRIARVNEEGGSERGIIF